MANDYISRDKAAKVLCMACGNAACDPFECSFYKEMEDIPAADVRPVVHGHYIGEYDGYADENPVYDMWYCSECGCLFEDWDEKPTYNFCPNCGCAMENEK